MNASDSGMVPPSISEFSLLRAKSTPSGGVSGVGPSSAGREPASAQQAWLREMERAQLANWFKPFSAPTPELPRSQPLAFREGFQQRPFAGGSSAAGESAHQDTQTARHPELGAEPSPPQLVPPQQMPTQQGGAAPEAHGMAQADSPSMLGRALYAGPAAGPQGMAHGMSLSAGGPATDFPMPTLPGNAMPPRVNGPDVTTEPGARAATAAVLPAATIIETIVQRLDRNLTTEIVDTLSWADRWATDTGASADEVSASEPNPSTALESASRRMPTGSSTAQAASVRTHSQWTPDGLQLWLGMDGTAQQVATRAAAVVQELQRALQAQGQRLSRVVCNGQVIHDSAAGIGPSQQLASFQQVFEQQSDRQPSLLPPDPSPVRNSHEY